MEFRFVKLKNKMGKWFEVGDLQYSRRGHVAITSGSKTLIFGGKGFDFSFVDQIEIWETRPTWEIRNLTKIELSLSGIYEDILFVVDKGFCRNN